MQRFFLKPECIQERKIVITDTATLHQMQRVLRMKQGDQFIALDNSGNEFLCEIEKITDGEIEAAILKKQQNISEPTPSITLYQALPKKMGLFEWVLQKGTEIGVSAFVPLITSHTERRVLSKPDRLKKILCEAAEQSERGKIPELLEPMDFEKAIARNQSEKKILFHCRGEFPVLSEKIAELKTHTLIGIFIGPEGGFSTAEIEKAQSNGISIYSLGPRILRTETAGIIAATILLYR